MGAIMTTVFAIFVLTFLLAVLIFEEEEEWEEEPRTYKEGDYVYVREAKSMARIVELKAQVNAQDRYILALCAEREERNDASKLQAFEKLFEMTKEELNGETSAVVSTDNSYITWVSISEHDIKTQSYKRKKMGKPQYTWLSLGLTLHPVTATSLGYTPEGQGYPVAPEGYGAYVDNVEVGSLAELAGFPTTLTSNWSDNRNHICEILAIENLRRKQGRRTPPHPKVFTDWDFRNILETIRDQRRDGLRIQIKMPKAPKDRRRLAEVDFDRSL